MQTTMWRSALPDPAVEIIKAHAIPLNETNRAFDKLLELIGDARVVLIGEASHGTQEFYEMRAELTQRLIEQKHFNCICAEADWPDAWRINRYVRGRGNDASADAALSDFKRFPTWMWRNKVVLAFVEWLCAHNQNLPESQRIGFYGLDLYSLYSSAAVVIDYLEAVDTDAAERARLRYACLSAFGADEQAYGYATSLGLTKSCEDEAVDQLMELRQREADYMQRDGRAALDEYFYIEQNARLVADAEEYYRNMFSGRVNTWNLRDTHMAETVYALDEYMSVQGRQMKTIIWAHNSHLGDARATQMGASGEINLGQLMREHYGGDVRLIGFSGYTGTVTAASSWGGLAERKDVRPALEGSYEMLFHRTDLPDFVLPLSAAELKGATYQPRLQRAIGVIYMPQSERMSHYFFTRLPDQFDAIIHFERSEALEPLEPTSQWVSGEMPTNDTGLLDS